MPSRSIKCWLEEDDVYAVIDSLSKRYPEDEIHIIDKGPLEFVANLRGLSHFYGGTLLAIASVIMRSVIQDHPLQDGNKRLGMILGNVFLENNNCTITQATLYTAIIEGVDVLITGDKDFGSIEIEKPDVITPAQFMEIYL